MAMMTMRNEIALIDDKDDVDDWDDQNDWYELDGQDDWDDCDERDYCVTRMTEMQQMKLGTIMQMSSAFVSLKQFVTQDSSLLV